jgi:hypothetical protein
MGITLFIVVGAGILFTATYVMTSHVISEPATEGEQTIVGLGDSMSDTLSGGDAAVARREWQVTTVSTLRDAEDLLDSLEAHGFGDRELVVLAKDAFAVRWR